MRSSYDSSTHQDLPREELRLRSQLLVSWDKEKRNLISFGLRPHLSLLEVGCGPGFATQELLRLVPEGSLTALEHDPVFIERARRYLGADATRVRFVEGSATNTSFADGEFDFIVARFLFQHIPDPAVAAAELMRVLKPGGRIVVVDTDDALWGLIDPPVPEAQAILARRAQLQKQRGGDRLIGGRLWPILENAGARNLAFEAVVVSSDEVGFDAFLPQLDPERFKPLVEEGLVSEAELCDLRAARQRFLETPGRSMLMLMLMVAGQKPA